MPEVGKALAIGIPATVALLTPLVVDSIRDEAESETQAGGSSAGSEPVEVAATLRLPGDVFWVGWRVPPGQDSLVGVDVGVPPPDHGQTVILADEERDNHTTVRLRGRAEGPCEADNVVPQNWPDATPPASTVPPSSWVPPGTLAPPPSTDPATVPANASGVWCLEVDLDQLGAGSEVAGIIATDRAELTLTATQRDWFWLRPLATILLGLGIGLAIGLWRNLMALWYRLTNPGRNLPAAASAVERFAWGEVVAVLVTLAATVVIVRQGAYAGKATFGTFGDYFVLFTTASAAVATGFVVTTISGWLPKPAGADDNLGPVQRSSVGKKVSGKRSTVDAFKPPHEAYEQALAGWDGLGDVDQRAQHGPLSELRAAAMTAAGNDAQRKQRISTLPDAPPAAQSPPPPPPAPTPT